MTGDNPLLSYLRRRAGDTLRVVAHYDAEGVDLDYVRDDLDRETAETTVADIHSRLTGRSESAGELRQEFGRRYISLQLRDEAVFLHFPTEADAGRIVTLETEAARQLTSFVAECSKRVFPKTAPV